MAHYLKRGDVRTLKWDLGRDLSAVTTARVLIARRVGETPFIDRAGVVESPAADGIVSLEVTAADYGPGKFEPSTQPHLVEVETQPGPLTHPDSGYEHVYVLDDLG